MKMLTEEIRTFNLVLCDFTMVSVNNRYQISAMGYMAKYGPNLFAAWQNSDDLLIAWQNSIYRRNKWL
jgi:hypothetical protein